jgi:hypothetical protein
MQVPPPAAILLPAVQAPATAGQPVDSQSVLFRLRLRKQGGRGDSDSKRLALPATSAIAVRLQAHQAKEAAERGELKKLVLAAERSQAEEEREAARASVATHRRSLAHRRQKNSGFRLKESDFHEEVRNVRGSL